jgi:IS5 family transposase
MKQGTLIDASLVPSAVNAPKRPDADLPPDAFGRPGSKLVRSEHDPDAAWTKKDGKYNFGYKLHAAMDQHSRIIRRVLVTPANINESQPADQLICGDEAIIYADKAYDSKERRESLRTRGIATSALSSSARPSNRSSVCSRTSMASHAPATEDWSETPAPSRSLPSP